jgi:glycerate dehydrogenase
MNLKTSLVFLNIGLYNYDKCLDLSSFLNDTSLVKTTLFDSCVGCDDTEILRRIGDNEIIITKEMKLSENVVRQLPSTVKVIMEAGTGFNNIPVLVCKERNITVMNCPAYSSKAVASLVITHVLNHASGIIPQQIMLHDNDKSNFFTKLSIPAFELENKVIGLVGGRGAIGTCVKNAALALGMKVIISSRSDAASDDENVVITSNLEYLLENSDFISLHCPMSDETKHIINEHTLANCKASCHLINTARGGLIDEDHLIKALENGVIDSCSLDVTSIEPLDEQSSLWSNPKVVLTPHMGWRRKETRQRLVDMLWGNVESWCLKDENTIAANRVS